jgi:flagellar protein FlaF
MKSAQRLQAIKDNWDQKRSELDAALLANRKIWTVFVTAVSQEDNPLPVEIRSNIASLGLFVFNQTIKMAVNPQPQQLTVLININRDIAAGLRGSTAAGTQGSVAAA